MEIAKSSIDVFNNEGPNKYFGSTYLILIQKYLLSPKNNLTEVTTFAWKCKFKI